MIEYGNHVKEVTQLSSTFPQAGRIEVPQDMPPAVQEMLTATIAEAWADFSPGKAFVTPEEFWDYLVGGTP